MKKFLFLAFSALFIISIMAVSVSADCNFFCRLNNVLTGNVVSVQQTCTVEGVSRTPAPNQCYTYFSENLTSVTDYWCVVNRHDNCLVQSQAKALVDASCLTGNVGYSFWEPEEYHFGQALIKYGSVEAAISSMTLYDSSVLEGYKNIFIDDISKYNVKIKVAVDDGAYVYVRGRLVNGIDLRTCYPNCLKTSEWIDITNMLVSGTNAIRFEAIDYHGCDTCGWGCGGRVFNIDWNITRTAAAACTDSDGGKDYNVKGATIGQPFVPGVGPGELARATYEDYCDSDPAYGGKRLRENYCTDNGLVAVELHDCPYGCQDGACLSSATSRCTIFSSYDYNDGQPIASSGCNDSKGVRYSYCLDSSTAMEYTCQDVNTCASTPIRVSCSDRGMGCLGGSCIAVPTECTDSDGGNDYYTQGIVTYSNGKTNADVCITRNDDGSWGDTAYAAPYILEYSCPTSANYGKDIYDCPYGCRDGACLTEYPGRPEPVCGDGECEYPYENATSCPADCKVGRYVIEQDIGDYLFAYSMGGGEIGTPMYIAVYMLGGITEQDAIVVPFNTRQEAENWAFELISEGSIIANFEQTGQQNFQGITNENIYVIADESTPDIEAGVLWISGNTVVIVFKMDLEAPYALPIAEAYINLYPSDLTFIEPKTCMELGGSKCRTYSECTGKSLPAADTDYCCTECGIAKTCDEGDTKYYSCMSGKRVLWCECIDGKFECIADISSMCGTLLEVAPVTCDGCMVDNKCLKTGQRVSGKYCSLFEGMTSQKETNEICDENYECLSNTCVRGKCVEQYGLIVQIWCRLKSFIEYPANVEMRDFSYEECVASY